MVSIFTYLYLIISLFPFEGELWHCVLDRRYGQRHQCDKHTNLLAGDSPLRHKRSARKFKRAQVIHAISYFVFRSCLFKHTFGAHSTPEGTGYAHNNAFVLSLEQETLFFFILFQGSVCTSVFGSRWSWRHSCWCIHCNKLCSHLVLDGVSRI